MGTDCAPLLTDQFLYSYQAEFIQKLLHEKKKSLAVAFNSTFLVEMRIWCIKIGTVYDLYYDPWVEASAGGLLVPEGLYSPVAMYYVTSLKYGYVFNCSGKIRNSYQN